MDTFVKATRPAGPPQLRAVRLAAEDPGVRHHGGGRQQAQGLHRRNQQPLPAGDRQLLLAQLRGDLAQEDGRVYFFTRPLVCCIWVLVFFFWVGYCDKGFLV
jgi:hypothetical protein